MTILGALGIASQAISLLTIAIPTFAKVIKFVVTAAGKFPTTAERLAWVQAQLKEAIPSFSDDKIYQWIVAVVNILRALGLKNI